MKPNFQEMPIDELKAYVLQHREDDEAFYAFIDRREAENPHPTVYPYPNTPETIAIMREAIHKRLGIDSDA
jgi:hypothetical protein